MTAHANFRAGWLKLVIWGAIAVAGAGSAAASPGTVALRSQASPPVDAAGAATGGAGTTANRLTGGATGDRASVPPVRSNSESPTRAQFATPAPCLVITANPLGACPVPAPRPQPPSGHPMIVWCPAVLGMPVMSLIVPRESVCGRGFHPDDAVLLVASGPHGSTGWRVIADASGNFVSPLPAMLCGIAPFSLFAIDAHGDRSNQLSVSRTICVRPPA